MVVFAVLVNPENKVLKELVNEFNLKLETNDKMIDGKVWFKGDILIFHINNYTSMIDLPRWITYKGIQIKWRRKGYKQTFKLISNQKLLEALIQ